MNAPGTLHSIIGRAIRDADTTIFSEDYNKQAAAVTKALRDAGYEILPAEPSPRLLEFVNENMPFGRMKPEDFLAELYRLYIKHAMRLR